MKTDIIKKIRSLLAKGKSTNNVHEAEIFTAKAHEMLVKHNLAIHDLAEEHSIEREVYISSKGIHASWAQDLFTNVARTYFCRLLLDNQTKKVEIIGAPHNVFVTVEMGQYLIKTVRRLAREACPNDTSSQLDFCKGAKVTLAIRLHDLRKSMMETPQGDGSNLPAVYNMEDRLNKHYVDENYSIRSFKSRKTRVGPSYLTGRKAAENISLNSQLKNKPMDVQGIGHVS